MVAREVRLGARLAAIAEIMAPQADAFVRFGLIDGGALPRARSAGSLAAIRAVVLA